MNRNVRSFLVLSANTPWVYALAESLGRDVPVHAVRIYDWRTYWAQSPTWPEVPEGVDLRQTMKALPPGYAGPLEPVVRPYLRSLLRQWQDDLEAHSGTRPWVIAPYFHLAPWVIPDVPSDRLVYYNLDEYTQYRPERAETIRSQETHLVENAACTVCLARHQVETLRHRHPEQDDRIHHFPLGVDERYINPDPTTPPTPKTVGYVGNLSDRVDWFFVRDVADQCPDLQFVFAGSAPGEVPDDAPEWKKVRQAVFSMSNVRHLGRIPQEEVTEVYWSCAVNWIPYDAEHPFNVASCPTKVMDTIASGRPIVSTPVPECTLYPEWIEVVGEPDAASSSLHDAVSSSRPPSGTRAQVQFAQTQTWDDRAHELLNILDGIHVT